MLMRVVVMVALFICPLYVSAQCRVTPDHVNFNNSVFFLRGHSIHSLSLSEESPVAHQILGGILGGALGIAAGGFAAKSAFDSDAAEVWGMAIGETVLLPLGVHWANESQGDPWLVFAGSYGVAALGASVAAVFAASSSESAWEPVAIGTVAAQIIVTTAIERGTSHSREKQKIEPAPRRKEERASLPDIPFDYGRNELAVPRRLSPRAPGCSGGG